MEVERFYLIRPDGSRDGPFDEPYIRFLLESDELTLQDRCETEDGVRVALAELYETLGDGEDRAAAEGGDTRRDGGAAGGKPGQRERGGGSAGRQQAVRVLYTGHPSFLKYRTAWLVTTAGGVGGYLLGPHSLGGMLAGFGVATLALCYILIDRSAHIYTISTRRVEAVHGLVAKDSTEIRVEDIRTINVKRDGFSGVLGVGTVEFSSTGDAIDVAFRDVWGARRIKKLVRRLQDRG